MLARAGVSAFGALQPAGIPRLVELGVDGRALLFAFALAAATGILFGLAPAFASARTRAASVLRESSPATTSGRARSGLRNALVVFQLSVATLLLAGAGVLLHSFVRLNRIDPGFEASGLLTMQLDTDARVAPAEREPFVAGLIARIEALPGVSSAGASWRLPFDRGRCCWSTRMYDAVAPIDSVQPYIHPVTPDYFRSLGVPVVEGRDFGPTERGTVAIPFGRGTPQSGQVPVVINRRMAEQLFPGRSAVGRSIAMMRMDAIELRVIGVIDGLRHWSMDMEPGPDVYVPFATVSEWHLGLLDFAIRHNGDASAIAGIVRSVVHELDPDLPIERIATMESRIAQSVATPRFYALLLITFAAIALVLAAAGVYSSMLYVVELRRREMGIRVALGAAGRDVVRLIVGRGARLVFAGTTLGLTSAFALARVLRSLVFEVSVTDPLALVFAALALAGTGLLACWLPARRAARSDPVSTLRAG
jgi:predicted permease